MMIGRIIEVSRSQSSLSAHFILISSFFIPSHPFLVCPSQLIPISRSGLEFVAISVIHFLEFHCLSFAVKLLFKIHYFSDQSLNFQHFSCPPVNKQNYPNEKTPRSN